MTKSTRVLVCSMSVSSRIFSVPVLCVWGLWPRLKWVFCYQTLLQSLFGHHSSPLSCCTSLFRSVIFFISFQLCQWVSALHVLNFLSRKLSLLPSSLHASSSALVCQLRVDALNLFYILVSESIPPCCFMQLTFLPICLTVVHAVALQFVCCAVCCSVFLVTMCGSTVLMRSQSSYLSVLAQKQCCCAVGVSCL